MPNPICDNDGRIVAYFLNSRFVKESNEGDAVDHAWTIKIAKGIPLDEIKRGLHEALDQHCQHSYDCCGHWYRHASTYDMKRAKRREYVLRVFWMQNV